MAAETPQQPTGGAPAPEAGGEAHPHKGGGGLSSFLPLIIAVVVMPVAAWVTITLKSKMDKKAPAHETEPEKGAEKSHAEPKEKSSGHGSESKEGKKSASSKSNERNIRLPVPLTREAVSYMPARDPEAGKPQDVDKIVTLDTKGETKDIAQADKIVVNIAGTKGTHYAVARISFLSDDPEFLERLNEKREKLLDLASGVLASKTMDEIETLGFKNFLKVELKGQFENALGRGGIIREVIITDFVVQ